MKVSLKCGGSFTRPVVNLYKVFRGCKGLVDIGALFPRMDCSGRVGMAW